MVKARANVSFALDCEQRFVGNISLADLIKHTQEKPASLPFDAIVDIHGLRLSPNDSLWSAMHSVKGFAGEAVPIVDEQSEQLLGILYQTDLIEAYLQALRELRNEETANV
jgi:CIC family chloride channel protein